VLVLTGTRVA